MTTKRTLMGAAAFSLALAGGGAAGALLGTPMISGAADEDTAADAGSGDTSTDAVSRWHHRGERLTAAADALGMTAEELRTELAGGSSIAEVAEARGVDVQDVVDALVAQATERLEEIEAALPERMEALVERAGPPERRGHRRGPGGWAPHPDAEAEAS